MSFDLLYEQPWVQTTSIFEVSLLANPWLSRKHRFTVKLDKDIKKNSPRSAQKKKHTEEKAKVVAAVWGTIFIQFHALLYRFSARAIWRKGWIRRTDAWQNGCSKKGWSSGSHHTKPPPFQNGCSFKKISSNHPCC